MTRHSVAPNNRQPSSLSIIKQWLPIPKNHLKLKPSSELSLVFRSVRGSSSSSFFDPDGVWPMVSNPRLRKFVPGSQADVLKRELNKLYTNLHRSLQVTFNGHPEKFGHALGLMFNFQ